MFFALKGSINIIQLIFKNMPKAIWLVVILGVILIALIGVIVFLPAKKAPNPGDGGIEITSLKSGQEISSPLKITGLVRGNGWAGFEGQVGTVRLIDNSGKELALGILAAITEWTTLPTNFETTINFLPPTAQSGTLVFKNENASGDPIRDKAFSLPVKIKSSGETMSIGAYFLNNNLDPEISCNKVFPATRIVPKNQAVARVSLEELFNGPTDSEKNQGYYTIINPGVKVQSLTIDGAGLAKADFSSELETTGGSCRVSAIRAQITQTLKQFTTIKNVIISINGRTEDILQP